MQAHEWKVAESVDLTEANWAQLLWRYRTDSVREYRFISIDADAKVFSLWFASDDSEENKRDGYIAWYAWENARLTKAGA